MKERSQLHMDPGSSFLLQVWGQETGEGYTWATLGVCLQDRMEATKDWVADIL